MAIFNSYVKLPEGSRRGDVRYSVIDVPNKPMVFCSAFQQEGLETKKLVWYSFVS